MKINKNLTTAMFVALAASAPSALAFAFTDTLDYNDNTATTYFIPPSAGVTTSPWYRYGNQDWGWTHNPIAGTFTSASLNISAYDVDFAQGEVDLITIVNGASISLGSLTGVNNAFSFTTFNLDLTNPNIVSAINNGMKVFMNINAGSGNWAVTLAKSSLSVDGGQLPDPNPTVPDGGTTLALLGAAMAGLAGLRRKLRA